MSQLSQEHQAILDKQVAEWTKEMRRVRPIAGRQQYDERTNYGYAETS
jgi:hypothetical protein